MPMLTPCRGDKTLGKDMLGYMPTAGKLRQTGEIVKLRVTVHTRKLTGGVKSKYGRGDIDLPQKSIKLRIGEKAQ